MSQKYQRVKIVIKFCQRFCRRFFTTLNRQIIWLLRAIFGTSRRQESGSAGFVLPTVVLVSLVVVLLTTAILFRAFDRSKNASYVRVNQALVNAAMPAVDRAKAKLNQLLSDPGLPRSTPTDVALYGLIKNIPSSTSNNTIYTAYNFGDETPLELALDVNGNGKLDNGYNSTGTTYTIENDESLNSAWKFPIDTDNNGLFDTYTIYAIYFRNPPRTTSGSQAGDFNRARSALEARTPPMNQYEAGGSCAAALGTSAGLVGDSSWYKLGGSLAKSFYVYTTNVPITNTDITNLNLSTSNYEVKVGRGLSSLEYEQDRFQSPIGNNAVWYVNDLEIYPGVNLYINGAIHTDANLMGGPTSSATLAFRQVSGINSCYYLEDNAKVTVGGNTAVGSVWSTSSNTSVFGNIEVDLYTIGAAPSTSNTIGSSGTTTDSLNSTQSTTEKTISQTSAAGYVVGYNDAAYNSRINLMTNTALSLCGSTSLTPPTAANNTCSTATTVTALKSAVDGTTTIYPSDLISSFDSAIRSANYPDSDYQDAYNTLNTQIQLYFSNRTRRVPFSEVPYTNTTSTNALYEYAGSTTAYAANGGTSVTNPVFATSPIDVPESWRDIVSNDGNSTKYTGLTFTSPFQFPATNPPDLAKKGYEIFTGDRILVGNNLPAYWRDYTQTNSPYVTGTATQTVDGTTNWLSTSGTSSGVLRTRSTQIQPQLNLGVTDRGQYWEQNAAIDPSTTNLANVGGMRIVTGAGIYVDDSTTNGDPSAYFPRTANSSNTNSNGNTSFSFLPVPTLDTAFVACPSNTSGLSNASSCKTVTTGLMPYPSPQLNTGSAATPSYQPDIFVWPDTMPMTSPLSTEYRQGDLIMRATAVYHYLNNAGISQTPIACISSYYDPTNANTAQNLSNLTKSWTTLTANYTNGRSNNGKVYTFPGRTLDTTTAALLQRQAMLVFPNGTVANQPLRTAMQKYINAGNSFKNFSYADYSAIDTALCSLGILKSMGISYMASQSVSANTSNTYINDNVIKEASFLDSREVKALQYLSDYQTTTKQGDYSLTLEQKSPLEVRTTDIDISALAKASISNSGNTVTDYLLPNSGIIYATRDDAIADCSYLTIDTTSSDFNTNTNANVPCNSTTINSSSQTDFKLDPTRRPNGIRLFNSGYSSTNKQGGVVLARGGANSSTYNPSEKGLILVTNLPAYIKGSFNLHTVNGTTQISEFVNSASISSASSWYAQSTLNTAFACRPGRTGCPSSSSSTGDLWRPATILADAVTILSDTFGEGYRVDGDFDLNRNDYSIPPGYAVNIGSTNGSTNGTSSNGLVNSFVNNANWVNTSSSTYAPTNKNSSYFANGITPIQRRVQFNEYLMESCNNIAYNCDDNSPLQWTVDGQNSASSLSGNPITGSGVTFPTSGTTACATYTSANGCTTGFNPTNSSTYSPRRVAFLRDSSGNLILEHYSNGNCVQGSSSIDFPVPLGVYTSGSIKTVQPVCYGTPLTSLPTSVSGALWFLTNTSSTTPTNLSSAYYAANYYLHLVGGVPTSAKYQPQLAPITQIFDPDGVPGNQSQISQVQGTITNPGLQQNWIQQAALSSQSANTFNVALAVGNSPSRPAEISAAFQNLVRLEENWNNGSSASQTSNTISGSFIQFKRSTYATAPYSPIIYVPSTGTFTGACTSAGTTFGTNTNGPGSIFQFSGQQCGGASNQSNQTLTYFVPPSRNWGFDVGLLSQLPDLFAQKFTVPPSNPPAEYFREVNSDDPWLQALLCAKQPDSGKTSSSFNTWAVPANYRPSSCSTLTYP